MIEFVRKLLYVNFFQNNFSRMKINLITVALYSGVHEYFVWGRP